MLRVNNISNPGLYEVIHFHGTFPDIDIDDYSGFQTRNQSVIALVKQAFESYYNHFEDKKINFIVYTGDRADVAKQLLQFAPVFAFSTTDEVKNEIHAIPDFVYKGWPEVGITTWEEMVDECLKKADTLYEYPRCFWIGNPKTHPTRITLLEISKNNPDILEALDMQWLTTKIDAFNTSTKFVSIPDHAKYKYLIDIQGVGYSARVKLLMHLGRPLFLQDRPYKEFFYQFMEPYKHYIPVKEDLSDLIEQIRMLEEDEAQYEYIVAEASKFAKECLNKDFAIKYLFNVIYNHGCI